MNRNVNDDYERELGYKPDSFLVTIACSTEIVKLV